jgi:hypothetical protein
MYAAPYDLLAAGLGATEDRRRGIVARWRQAGLADSGRFSEGAVVGHAARQLPPEQAARVAVQPVPSAALMPRATPS